MYQKSLSDGGISTLEQLLKLKESELEQMTGADSRHLRRIAHALEWVQHKLASPNHKTRVAGVTDKVWIVLQDCVGGYINMDTHVVSPSHKTRVAGVTGKVWIVLQVCVGAYINIRVVAEALTVVQMEIRPHLSFSMS